MRKKLSLSEEFCKDKPSDISVPVSLPDKDMPLPSPLPFDPAKFFDSLSDQQQDEVILSIIDNPASLVRFLDFIFAESDNIPENIEYYHLLPLVDNPGPPCSSFSPFKSHLSIFY